MAFFDKKENVLQYIKMAEGIDGRELIEKLEKYLQPGATVLELGMGPGKDLDILKETFIATGSDNSRIFLDLYRENNPYADLVFLDAVDMNIQRKFDGIYSNKVLIHLTKEELNKSLTNQCPVLNKNGILFHSFWYGDKEEEYNGLRFVYYNEDTFLKIIDGRFIVLEFQKYKEMKKDDSFYVVMKCA